MLSGPPLVRKVNSLRQASCGCLSATTLRINLLKPGSRSSVHAQARRGQPPRDGVNVQVFVLPDRAVEHVPLRMLGRLAGWLVQLDQPLHQGVIARDLFMPSVIR